MSTALARFVKTMIVVAGSGPVAASRLLYGIAATLRLSTRFPLGYCRSHVAIIQNVSSWTLPRRSYVEKSDLGADAAGAAHRHTSAVGAGTRGRRRTARSGGPASSPA